MTTKTPHYDDLPRTAQDARDALASMRAQAAAHRAAWEGLLYVAATPAMLDVPAMEAHEKAIAELRALGAVLEDWLAQHDVTPGPWQFQPEDSGDRSVGIWPTPPQIVADVPNGDSVVICDLQAPAYTLPLDEWTDAERRDAKSGEHYGDYSPGTRFAGNAVANGAWIVACTTACAGMADPVNEIAGLREQLKFLQEVACAVVADIQEDGGEAIDDLGEWFRGVVEHLSPHLPDGMLAETLKARAEEDESDG